MHELYTKIINDMIGIKTTHDLLKSRKTAGAKSFLSCLRFQKFKTEVVLICLFHVSNKKTRETEKNKIKIRSIESSENTSIDNHGTKSLVQNKRQNSRASRGRHGKHSVKRSGPQTGEDGSYQKCQLGGNKRICWIQKTSSENVNGIKVATLEIEKKN